MSKIIAARFNDLSGVKAVLAALPAQGFQQTEFQSFYVNPGGQHDLGPISGDEGAKFADEGAIRGAVIENSPYLETQEFEDELVRLCLLFDRK